MSDVAVTVVSSKLKSEPGEPLLVGLELQCGNCGALDYINVSTAEEAESRSCWCPVCEDDQDPKAAVERFVNLARPQ